MRRGFSISLLILYLAMIVRPVAPYIFFEANSDYIVQTLCVERDQKVNKCNGHCYLMKQLKDNHSQEKSNLPQPNSEKEQSVWQTLVVAQTYPVIVQGFNLKLRSENERINNQYYSELTVPPPQTNAVSKLS